MIRRDYLQELGLDPVEKKVPWPYALVILAMLLAGIEWFTGWEAKFPHPPLSPKNQAVLVTHQPAHSAATTPAPVKSGPDSRRHGVT